jgi:hypothetical protein
LRREIRVLVSAATLSDHWSDVEYSRLMLNTSIVFVICVIAQVEGNASAHGHALLLIAPHLPLVWCTQGLAMIPDGETVSAQELIDMKMAGD